jgi:hypothetical protein
MAEVVKAETHLLSFLDHSGLHCRRPQVPLHHDGRGQWLLALQPDAREHEVGVLGERRLVAPSEKKPSQQRVHGNWGLRRLRLRHLKPSPHISSSHVHHEIREVQIRPHQGQQLRYSQGRSRIAQRERAPWLWNVEENLERLLRRHGDRRVIAGRSLAHNSWDCLPVAAAEVRAAARACRRGA